MTSYTVTKSNRSQNPEVSIIELKSSLINEDISRIGLGTNDKVNRAFSMFKGSNLIIQFLTLCITVYIAYRNPHILLLNSELLIAFMTVLFVCLITILLTFNKTELKFDMIYLIYLSLLVSVVFYNHSIINIEASISNVIINLVLTTNIMESLYVVKLLIQSLLFILINSFENYNDINSNNKFTQLLGASVTNFVFSKALAKIGGLRSLDIVDCNIFSLLLTNVLYLNRIHEDSTIPFMVLSQCLLAFLTVILINYVIETRLISSYRPYVRSFVCLGNILIVLPFLVKYSLIIDGHDPLEWLISFVLESNARQIIMTIWLASVVVLIPSVMTIKDKMSLNTSRKVWHFLIILLIVYPFKIEELLVKIALSGSIVLFMVVEYIRYMKFEPIGNYLDIQLRSFADYRDENGSLIISYLYLIIGVSTPLLISGSPAGLVGLGVGDALASIVGGRWGRLKWSSTNKTIEGTLAFITSTTLVCVFLKQYLEYYQEISVTNLFNMCVLAGILEGNSVLNDNILIPSFMLILEELFINI
ncbi:hypothetical protein TPHA_0I02410 [Tetrapisispora phaffii CBS 4417]|uniref:dolichol kinase n=1 Tax=Tetrapisispora phaffii (strain ATCC 24235 / CBS 4417 / NBRC 1672 / NRRL Y-8282 / UCD 70-5) TaxID=1071381 RepID=G8BXW6_TETPH|nr:hypothetical protein TPHA_0I02410 [Tetrapisispora phaffii CBS 4417]CCE64744.1 hypothetical protein TPHA_0I02410 [Tetrapisispora phaffii CBS 4417]